jgi:hypothetical protein
MTPVIISNTEITSKNTCDKQHEYMYNHSLEPRQYSLSIRRGIAGHKVLETYFTYRKDGFSHEDSVNYAMNTLFDTIVESDPYDTEHTKMLTHLAWLFPKYFEHYKDDDYKVVAVEKVLSAPMVDDIHFGMYLDVVVERTTGEFRGSLDVMDHKFVYNFKSNDELKLDPQQPKYVMAGRLAGYPIRQAIYNQIRYRSMKDPKPEDLFRRSPLLSSDTAIKTVWEEATETVLDIHTGPQVTRRRQSYSACKNCFFKDLCMAELDGQDTTVMRQAQYQKRSRPLKDWMLTNNV